MFRIAICDDGNAICSQIEKIIYDYSATASQKFDVEIFYSGIELCEFMENEHNFDLIFLDIEMTAMDGVEIGKIIREKHDNQAVQIVYISAKDSYCLQLFEIRPLNFLSKPITAAQIIKCIDLAVKLSEKMAGNFKYKQGHTSCSEPIKDILYFESTGRKIKLVTLKNAYYFYDKIEAVANQVLGLRFLQPHRSYLVNYDNISSIKSDGITMLNGDKIPVSRLKSKEIRILQIAYEEEK